jgi:tryptophan synthase alpha chain
MNGLEHIQKTFAILRSQKRAALMPYFTLGYPDAETSLEVIQTIARSGADLIELGIPFSDPLADGPTIQRSTQQALEQGMTVKGCLQLTRELRRSGVRQPLILMSYLNPLLSYGLSQFVADAVAAGVDGLIVPDLPPEDADELEAACQEYGLAQIYLLAPNSTPERIDLVASRSNGFIYLVSVTGVTGARGQLPTDLADFIRRVREVTEKPLAVGFGISTPEQAARIAELADGVIVGSALIHAVTESKIPAEGVSPFLQPIAAALGIATIIVNSY